MTPTATASAKSLQATAAPARRSRFFVGMAALLLLTILAGFARTFYLRPYFGLPRLPVHLYLHGIILTAWVLLVFAQTCLVATHRTHIHRRLGIAGLALAAGVVAISLFTLAIREAPFIDQAPRRSFGNLMSVVAFAACILSGAWLRNRPAAHKRLMLLACIPLAGPALDRMASRPPLSEVSQAIFAGVLGPPGVAFATAGVLTLFLVVVLRDAVLEKRVHPATLWGLISVWVIAPAITAALMFSGVWRAFVRLVR